jgi:hypothetical protein
MSWLHSAVFERYGEEHCRAYIETTELAFDVTLRKVLDPAPWDWLTNDGPANQFDASIEVEIARIVGSETSLQLMKLVPEDGELRWLTDCGDPQP